MRDGREYISVQSIPSLKNEDRAMVLAPEGWRISFCKNENKKNEILSKYSINGIFNLNELLKVAEDNSEILKNITLYKEITI